HRVGHGFVGVEDLLVVRTAQSWVRLYFNCFDAALLGVGKRPCGRNRMLTGAQRATYDRDGFIVVPEIFSAEDIAELRRVPDEFLPASATVTANDSIYDLEDTHSADEPRVRRLKGPHAIHPVYMRASRHPKIVELLTDLWGSLRFD